MFFNRPDEIRKTRGMHENLCMKARQTSGSLVIPVKSISMIYQVNKEYPSMLVILLLSGYYGFF